MTSELGPAEDRIDILLATYNGERFLAEQLDSIVSQTHKNWRILIRDDGSSDGTGKIIEAFRARHPDKMTVIEDRDGNIGLVQNFSRLMERSDAPYAAFCDQDDVWIPEKLDLSLAKMRELERNNGSNTPLLIFTDLVLVDENTKVIHPSFWRYQGLQPERCGSLNQLLVLNVVTGCTSLLNRQLVRKTAPLPAQVQAHDWWVALVAAALGYASYVSEPGVLYRQHGNNAFGARRGHVYNLPMRGCLLLKDFGRRRVFVGDSFKQAAAFQRQYMNDLGELETQVLATFSTIPDQNFFQRIITATRCQCWPNGMLRKFVFALSSRGS